MFSVIVFFSAFWNEEIHPTLAEGFFTLMEQVRLVEDEEPAPAR